MQGNVIFPFDEKSVLLISEDITKNYISEGEFATGFYRHNNSRTHAMASSCIANAIA